MHGLRTFQDCEIEDCPSCAKFIDRTPLPKLAMASGISRSGAPGYFRTRTPDKERQRKSRANRANG